LKSGNIEYKTAKNILGELRKKFREGNEEVGKIAELRRLEQGGRTMEEFVQEFRRATRESGYKGQFLVEEFKRSMNQTI